MARHKVYTLPIMQSNRICVALGLKEGGGNHTLPCTIKLSHQLLFLMTLSCSSHFSLPASQSTCFVVAQLLSDVEEHLKCTITQCEPDIKVPLDDFDGKVTYGQRRAAGGGVCVCDYMQ